MTLGPLKKIVVKNCVSKTFSVHEIPDVGCGGRCHLFLQLLQMGIECPYATGHALAAPLLYATGRALAAPLPGPRFVDCDDNFRSILLCKVPYSILILTNAGARGPTKENAYRFSSFQAP